jgi:N-sulfoglucosamine sulfohydrolase
MHEDKHLVKLPNIFFAIADDWGWPHAQLYGDQVVQTPTFESIVRKGILFQNAFVSAPSCTPSRNAILTGQYHWRLGTGANLYGSLPAEHKTYANLLEDKGYFVGTYRKAFGPGKDRERKAAGKPYKSFKEFLDQRPTDKPFCFWSGSSDPHRGYKWESGTKSGMKLEDVTVPPCFPDNKKVRTDICDYYFEVQRFDREVGEQLKLLAEAGELDNTLIVMTGDHGWPFPRGKSNLYDLGTHVPLAIQWGTKIKKGRVVDDFVETVEKPIHYTIYILCQVSKSLIYQIWL